MSESSILIEELLRRLERFEAMMERMRDSIESRFLPYDLYEARHQALKNRVEAVEKQCQKMEAERVENRRWLQRAIALQVLAVVGGVAVYAITVGVIGS